MKKLLLLRVVFIALMFGFIGFTYLSIRYDDPMLFIISLVFGILLIPAFISVSHAYETYMIEKQELFDISMQQEIEMI